MSGAHAEGDAELDAEIQKERASQGTVRPNSELSFTSTAGGPLLGARRDLSVVAAQAPLECACLKLGLGEPNLPAFRWKASPPTIDPTTQLVVGLSSDGVTCEQPEGSLGASYWGYKLSGNDVVVYVESAVKGRPLTSGAVIPKPYGEGQVYAAPAFRKEPYGRGAKGEARCKLGNPGPVRATRPSPSDTGEPAEEG